MLTSRLIKKILDQNNKIFVTALLCAATPLFFGGDTVLAHPKSLTYPVIGNSNYSNDFTAARGNGVHNATDIFAAKRTKIVAAVAGTITYVPIQQPSWGFMVTIKDVDGFEYSYIHMNNDRPGTDDGNGGPYYAYAPDIVRGAKVAKGQHIGYVGDSGNAETTPPHLHFEITAPGGEKINPYPYLMEAVRIEKPASYLPVGSEILPYGPDINAPVSIATAAFNANGDPGIIMGTGRGFSPHIRGVDAEGSERFGFYAYGQTFTGGVDVASGDVDGDGIDEIITGTLSGAPHVRVFGIDGKEKASFYAYSPQFEGGVNVASIDIDGDGKDEILVAPGRGGSPHVRVLKLSGEEIVGFYAYATSYQGGVDVSSGDVWGDGAEEVVTSPGPGGSAHVRVFSSSGQAVWQGFNAYEAYTGYTGGARISVGNVDEASSKAEILVGPWLNGGPHFRLFEQDGSVVDEGYYYESWWTGNYDVAAGEGVSYVATGETRRSSIRKGPM